MRDRILGPVDTAAAIIEETKDGFDQRIPFVAGGNHVFAVMQRLRVIRDFRQLLVRALLHEEMNTENRLDVCLLQLVKASSVEGQKGKVQLELSGREMSEIGMELIGDIEQIEGCQSYREQVPGRAFIELHYAFEREGGKIQTKYLVSEMHEVLGDD